MATAPTPRFAFVAGQLHLGGSTTFLCNLGGELVKRGVACLVASFDARHEMAADFSARRIPVSLPYHGGEIFEDRLTAILQELREFRPTVVVATICATAFEVLRYVPTGPLRVGMVQADDEAVYDLIRTYAAVLDVVVAVSQRIADRLRAMPDRGSAVVHYIPYGVPMPVAERPRAGVTDGPLRILYLGRLSAVQKRVHLFPRILRNLQARGLSFVWTIAGDGPDRAWLEREMECSAVKFIGAVPYGAVPSLLAEQDVYLLTSDFEGLPLSLLEAMGHGLVPVVSDLASGIREVVDATTGILVDPADVSGYSRALVWLGENRSQLQEFSARAAARVRTAFSTDVMADRWLALAKDADASAWPTTVTVHPMLGARWPWKFSATARALRRLGKKLVSSPR